MHDLFTVQTNSIIVSVRRICRLFLIALAVLQPIRPVSAQPGERKVEFLSNHSLGVLITRPWNSTENQDWVLLGEATGTITVPAGMALGLHYRGYMLPQFSDLSRLGPDTLQFLDLSYGQLQEEHLKILGGLAGLKYLYLTDTGMTDSLLVHLSTLTSLESLELRGTPVTGSGLASLAGLPNLKSLSLHVSQFNNSGVDALVQIKSLEYVGLWLTHVTSDQVHKLSQLPRLKSADFSGNINNYGCEALSKISTLEAIYLNDNDMITDEGIALLGRLPNLKTLRVNSAGVTDKSLQALAQSPSLQRLTLVRSKTTLAGANDFKKAKPGCVLNR